MKLSRLTIILLVIALLSGGAAAFGARSYITNAIARYQAGIDARYQKVKVVVATSDLHSGSELSTQNVVAREVPKEFLHKDAITINQWDRFAGRATRANLTGGAPILKSQLLEPQVDSLADILVEGKRALTVPVDQISSISGLLSPGDRVDILLTVDEANNKPVTLPIMKDIEVLATGVRINEEVDQNRRSGRKKDRGGRFNTVTMLVDPEQAAKIVHARKEGTLTVVLRPSEDTTEKWPDRVTLASLLGIVEKPPKRIVLPRRVEVIIGGQGVLEQ